MMRNLIILSAVLYAVILDYSKLQAQSVDVQQKNYINADSLEKSGKFQEAAEAYEKAVVSDKDSSEQSIKIASKAYTNAGSCYYQIGQFDKAIENYQKGLAINRKLRNNAAISTSLNNIGMVFKAWGNYDKALENYQQSQELDEKANDKASLSTDMNNIGSVYYSKGQNEKALEFYRKALKLDGELQNVEKMAIRFNNLASVYQDMKQYKQAMEYYMKAFDIYRQAENQKSIATTLNNLASLYMNWKNYPKSIEYYNEALKIDSIMKNQKGTADRLNNLGMVYKLDGKYNEAIGYFNKSVELKEKLRLTAPGDIRRDYLASQIDTYQNLILSYIKNNDLANAFRVIELSSSKVLAERLSKSDNSFSQVSLETVQKGLSPQSAVLIYTTIDQPDITLMVITKEKTTAFERKKSDLVNTAISNPQVKTFILSKLPFEELEKFQAFADAKQEDRDKKFEEKIFEVIIHSYRGMLMKPKADNASKMEELSKLFYNFLIDPLAENLKDKKELMVAPGGILGYLPFETLQDKDGKYMVENYTVTYTQSLSVSEMLKTRKYPATRKPLLALGGAVYNEKTYKEDMSSAEKIQLRGGGMGKINPKQLAYIQKKVDKAIQENKPLSQEYKSLGYENWANLKGSLVEVRAITQIISKADTIVGDKVTETNFKALSKEKKLSNYKVLHFSCHGMTIPELPEMSALVLSQLEAVNEKDNQDGYLRMGEIAGLNLQADFVDLSACETGLGKIYSGEGVVGLSQSFLIAGANGISVSLWEVADKSTAMFMVELYRLVEKEKMTYPQAINEVKRKFINGDFGYFWKMPFYWAPFVYYGQ
ncbi:MAG: CHAT domain-containing protein [Bacteroidia bacterium]|nr:CHAT domain-containing protein [Bacteroidia bacterium]